MIITATNDTTKDRAIMRQLLKTIRERDFEESTYRMIEKHVYDFDLKFLEFNDFNGRTSFMFSFLKNDHIMELYSFHRKEAVNHDYYSIEYKLQKNMKTDRKNGPALIEYMGEELMTKSYFLNGEVVEDELQYLILTMEEAKNDN